MQKGQRSKVIDSVLKMEMDEVKVIPSSFLSSHLLCCVISVRGNGISITMLRVDLICSDTGHIMHTQTVSSNRTLKDSQLHRELQRHCGDNTERTCSS